MAELPAAVAGNLPHRSGFVRLNQRRNPLETAPPEALFIVSGISQYFGTVIAVRLFEQLAPAPSAWFRVIGAACWLLLFSAGDLRRNGRFTRPQLKAAALFGVATAFMNLTFYLAINRLDLGKGVAIEFIGPITVAALTTRTKRNAMALALAVGGVVVLSGIEIDKEPLGLVFIFLAALCWALYIVIGARVAQYNRGVAGLGVGLAIGAVVLTPFGVPQSGAAWSDISLIGWCFMIGLFSNAVAYGIDQYTLRRIPVRRFSVLLALLPVTATVFGFLFLDQTPSLADLVGIALVLAGVVIQQRDVLPTNEPLRD
ncbi:MAG: EamA family transporter [Actinomycetota bacterium]